MAPINAAERANLVAPARDFPHEALHEEGRMAKVRRVREPEFVEGEPPASSIPRPAPDSLPFSWQIPIQTTDSWVVRFLKNEQSSTLNATLRQAFLALAVQRLAKALKVSVTELLA